MNWDNYGNTPNSWSIDHITPISSAQTEEEIYNFNGNNSISLTCNILAVCIL